MLFIIVLLHMKYFISWLLGVPIGVLVLIWRGYGIMNEYFAIFASVCSRIAGMPLAKVLAFLTVIVWGAQVPTISIQILDKSSRKALIILFSTFII